MELNRGSIKMELNSYILNGKNEKIDGIDNVTFVKIGSKEIQEVRTQVSKMFISRKKKRILEAALEKVTEEYEITKFIDRFGEINYLSFNSKGNVNGISEEFKCCYWKKSHQYEKTQILELASLYEVMIFNEYQKLQKQKREKSDEASRSILVQYNFAFALIDEKDKILGYFYPNNHLEVLEGKNPNHSYLFSLGCWQKASKKDTTG